MTVRFDGFVLKDSPAIYRQVVLYVKEGIVSGVVNDGDEMPSRRVLSALLGVNPNTIQKAYKYLEDEGLIESHVGAKSYVRVTDARISRLREELFQIRITDMVSALRQMGVGREEALGLIDKLWEVTDSNE